MAEAPTIEQADVLLPQEEVRRRTSVLQNSLIEGLKLRPECVESALERYVKGPSHNYVQGPSRNDDMTVVEGGKSYKIKSYKISSESGIGTQHLEIIAPEGVVVIDDNDWGDKGEPHVRLIFYDSNREGTKGLVNTPGAFDGAETLLAPILPKKG